MPENAHFEPILKTHAVERCGVVVLFDGELPEKSYARVLDTAQRRLPHQNYTAARAAMSFKIHAATGAVDRNIDEGASVYNLTDGGFTIDIQRNMIGFQTTKYVRWKPFIGKFRQGIEEICDQYLQSVNVLALQLDYNDKFFWTGSWDDFDYRLALNEKSGFISSAPHRSTREWHSHSGWFDFSNEIRRLVNFNIAVVEAINGVKVMPAIDIFSMIQDQVKGGSRFANEAFKDSSAIISRLDGMHDAAKDLLSEALTQSMSEQIRLREP